MAAKNVNDWIIENYKLIRTGLRYQECWDAATKAAEEKFTSTNMQSVLCKLYEKCNNSEKGCFCENTPRCFQG